MHRGLNKVMVIGRVEGTPELRHTASGRPVASFTVATPRVWKSADGQSHNDTEWFNVVAWGPLAERCQQQLSDSRQLYVEGRLQTRGWKDEHGGQQFRTEVVANEIIVIGGDE